MLSTALLLSAVTKTLLLCLTSCWINSTNVLVFPVPKGPCIKKKFSVFTAFLTAFFWDSLRDLSIKSIYFSFLFSLGSLFFKEYSRAFFPFVFKCIRLSSIRLKVTSFAYKSILTFFLRVHFGIDFSKATLINLAPFSTTVPVKSLLKG